METGKQRANSGRERVNKIEEKAMDGGHGKARAEPAEARSKLNNSHSVQHERTNCSGRKKLRSEEQTNGRKQKANTDGKTERNTHDDQGKKGSVSTKNSRSK